MTAITLLRQRLATRPPAFEARRARDFIIQPPSQERAPPRHSASSPRRMANSTSDVASAIVLLDCVARYWAAEAFGAPSWLVCGTNSRTTVQRYLPLCHAYDQSPGNARPLTGASSLVKF